MKKTIKSNELNGFISAQYKSANSITLLAELPKNMKVEHIRLIGDVEVNGTKYENPYVENLDGVVVQYHKGTDEIATAYFFEGIPEKLLADVQNYVLDEFEVTYTEVCAHCGK